MLKTDSTFSDNSIVKNLISKYEHDTDTETDAPNVLRCSECVVDRTNTPFMILSCNHMYHVVCLAETQLSDVYKYPTIDGDYFRHRLCKVCQRPLETEELVFLHSKYLSTTKDHIEMHSDNVSRLEKQLFDMKSELRVCYEYLHKLEAQREKSKQIISVLSTHDN